MLADFLPFFLMLVVATGIALVFLNVSGWFGPRRPRRVKTMAYESGMDPVGTARERYSVKFYLVAMIFIVFDVEIVFLYPWAVSFSGLVEQGAGLGAFAVIAVFLFILVVGLIYDLKKGGLDFEG